MAVDLYASHFGFTTRPFSLLPDPNLLYWSKQHKRAFAVLEYSLVAEAPITVVTGEVGTGKTTLVQALLRQVPKTARVGLISNAQGGRGDLLRWVLNALDVEIPDDVGYVSLFQRFQDFVISEYAKGFNVILIIDEAQNLGADLLEELRMLNNINSGQDTLLQLVLVGQPEFRELITQPSLRQFAQRVNVFYHIDPMDLKTTTAYIRHRLTEVGGTGEEISTDAINRIFHHSGGIPRMINKICDMALVYAASDGGPGVTGSTIQELLDDGAILSPRPEPLVLTKDMRHYRNAAE